ncbi:leucyl aminopeptidase family protein [Tannockella kyphosi]|uniref:leucyl aminopeptidase family protein n=1 Tax=Tannockella kyphosi TaxID=2899121 RepID=UPI002010EB1B|nr:leucyl aminopeptidase family protein [Tannockella kyphosi]
MIKINNKKNTDFLVEIIDPSSFKDFHLGFKSHVYDAKTKTISFAGKESYDNEELMELFARIYKTVEAMKLDAVSINILNFSSNQYYAIVMGLVLASYKLKEKDEVNIEITLITDSKKEAFEEYLIVASNMNFAKMLSNAPACNMTPQIFVDVATKALEGQANVSIDVILEEEIVQKGMGGLYGVGKGSANRPCMLVINYTPLENQAVFGLVGKGVTFDTGGYSLKPSASMVGMKSDMGGAASVLAVIKSAIEQKVQRNLVAIMPLCENRISDSSILPGDIISMYDGTTVEVLNTDAEGRLILADAVSYAINDKKVAGVIDMATLTGAAVAAFGHTITPILTNNDCLWEDLKSAYEFTQEKFISMPYYKEHYKMIESKMADLKNLGGKSCGVVTAGLFIEHFASSVPWMHFDIAGTHDVEAPLYEYQQAGCVSGAIPSVYYMIKK